MKITIAFLLVCLWLFFSVTWARRESPNKERSKEESAPRGEGIFTKNAKSLHTATAKEVFLRVTNHMKDQNATSGESVVFKCKVDGWPKNNIEYTWYKEDSLLDSAFDQRISISLRPWGSRLRIKDLFTLDSGLYRCEASNDFRRVFSSASLTVSFERPPPPLDHEKPILKFPAGKCEKYEGVVCNKYLNGKSIYVDGFQSQEEMEKQIQMALSQISDQRFVRAECQKFAVPAFCHFAFASCRVNEAGITVREGRLCREDCELLKHDICHKEYLQRNEHPFLNELFNTANCSHLPSGKGSKCVKVGLPSVNTVEECYHDNGIEYRGESDISASGLPCELWPSRFVAKYQELGAGHKFCRNPGQKMFKPWCFIDKAGKIKALCNVKKCDIEKDNKPNILLIAIASASGAIAILALSAIYCLCRRRKRRHNLRSPKKHPEKTPLYFPVQAHQINLPQLSSRSIHILNEIGNGEYGKVYRGIIIDDSRFQNKQPYAVKMLSENATAAEVQLFEREMEILSRLSHPNITSLKGVAFQRSCMVFDYTTQVDLHEYLVSKAPNTDVAKHITLDSFGSSNADNLDFLKMAMQAASGMEYLTSNNYIHRDLAARNVLVCGNMDLKICNLGVVKDCYLSSYHRLSKDRLWPVRWMAPESLQSWEFSDKSVVWSFGVLLWEMFSYGLQPYCGYSNHEVLDMISRRQLLTCPDQCPAKIYSLMCECWSSQLQLRPKFKDISCKLSSLTLEQSRCQKSLTCFRNIDSSLMSPSPPPQYTSRSSSYVAPWTESRAASEQMYLSGSEISTSLLNPKG